VFLGEKAPNIPYIKTGKQEKEQLFPDMLK
jgi:hypothetical protein